MSVIDVCMFILYSMLNYWKAPLVCPNSLPVSLLLFRGLDFDGGSEGGSGPLCGWGGEGSRGRGSSSLPEESDCSGTGTLGPGAQQAAACQCAGTYLTVCIPWACPEIVHYTACTLRLSWGSLQVGSSWNKTQINNQIVTFVNTFCMRNLIFTSVTFCENHKVRLTNERRCWSEPWMIKYW